MTSHYMRCAVKDIFSKVFDAMSLAFGDIHVRHLGKINGLEKGIVLGEHYFFRTGSDAAVIIIWRRGRWQRQELRQSLGQAARACSRSHRAFTPATFTT